MGQKVILYIPVPSSDFHCGKELFLTIKQLNNRTIYPRNIVLSADLTNRIQPSPQILKVVHMGRETLQAILGRIVCCTSTAQLPLLRRIFQFDIYPCSAYQKLQKVKKLITHTSSCMIKALLCLLNFCRQFLNFSRKFSFFLPQGPTTKKQLVKSYQNR